MCVYQFAKYVVEAFNIRESACDDVAPAGAVGAQTRDLL
jgi:hypothetical protein